MTIHVTAAESGEDGGWATPARGVEGIRFGKAAREPGGATVKSRPGF